MSLADFRAFYGWLVRYCHHIGARRIELSWFGGEPLICGVEFLESALMLQKELLLPCLRIPVVNRMQSNLTLVNENVCRIIREYFDGMISGSLEPFGEERIFVDGSMALPVVEEKIRFLNNHKIRVGVVCTLTKRDMISPSAFFQYFKKRVEAVRVNRAHPPPNDTWRDYLSIHEYTNYVLSLIEMFIKDECPGFDLVNFTSIARAFLLGHTLNCVSRQNPEWKIAISGQGVVSSYCRKHEIVLGSIYESSPAAVVNAAKMAAQEIVTPAICQKCGFYASGICAASCMGEPKLDCNSSLCGYRTECTRKILSRVRDLMLKCGISTIRDLDCFRCGKLKKGTIEWQSDLL